MADEPQDAGAGPSPGGAESPGRAEQAAASAPKMEDAPELARRYGLSEEAARQCVAAFDDLLHLDRHTDGLARIVKLGPPAGRFLLDQLTGCTLEHSEARPHFIAEALCQCLDASVEADLANLLKNRSLPPDIRQFAVVALAQGSEDASRELLVDLFCEYMQRSRSKREPLMYRALILAMDSIKSPRSVPGLTRVIAEERRAASIDLVMAAIDALGEIGDERAIKPLRKLLKDRRRWPVAPMICRALARLKDDKAGDLARAARAKQFNWTAWQLDVFNEAETLAAAPAADAGEADDKTKDKQSGE